WYETFGVNCHNNFNRCSRRLLYCTKSEHDFVFHREAVSRPSSRQTKYNDGRADPDGKIWDDVWGVEPPIPRPMDNQPGRVGGFPTQLPLRLLTPIVGVASDPGDLVLDLFAGSGSFGEAAVSLGRRFIGFETNDEYARQARMRLRAANR